MPKTRAGKVSLDPSQCLGHEPHIFLRHIPQEFYRDVHQFRLDKSQAFRRDAVLQASYLLAHRQRKLYCHEALSPSSKDTAFAGGGDRVSVAGQNAALYLGLGRNPCLLSYFHLHRIDKQIDLSGRDIY